MSFPGSTNPIGLLEDHVGQSVHATCFHGACFHATIVAELRAGQEREDIRHKELMELEHNKHDLITCN